MNRKSIATNIARKLWAQCGGFNHQHLQGSSTIQMQRTVETTGADFEVTSRR